ncbi:MAG: GNAT family N-acetyltransferase [Ignavibacteriaceae bacterium]|nr:GNAT family N-acetyltransferase [Ignavibacteriaceae bacterium]
MKVENLYKENIPEVADVLCEAFYDYPVMKYVLGDKEDYDNRLRKAVTFFVSARALRKEPLLGIYNSEKKLVAAAAVTLPGEIPSPPELFKLRDKLWAELGSKEKARYDNYGNVASGLLPTEPHHHLNMIGVRNAYQGKGFARQLINKVEELVSEHPKSAGLSLNTEVESNVNFYLHLGFDLLGKATVVSQAVTDESVTEASHGTTVTSLNDVVTWGFFKARKK